MFFALVAFDVLLLALDVTIYLEYFGASVGSAWVFIAMVAIGITWYWTTGE